MLKQIIDGVWVHQSEVLQNNTAIIHGQDGVIVVDPGITEGEILDIANDIEEMDQTVVAGFATHPDWDHVLWHEKLGIAPRYATSNAANFMKDFRSKADWREETSQGLPPEVATEVRLELFGQLTALDEGATQIPWSGPVVQVIEHRAHAQGHAALFIREKGVLIAGDMLSDLFVPMLDMQRSDPIGDYLQALDQFEALADDIKIIVPGHGSVAENNEVSERLKRDRAYVLALRDNTLIDDPRITSPKEGWEWAVSVHEGQAAQITNKKSGNGISTKN